MKISRARAVKEKCVDCSGFSAKEVTLCQVFNCPLWPFRFGAGYSMGSKPFNERMERAKKQFPKEIEEIRKTLLENDMEYYREIANRDVKAFIGLFFGLKQ